MEVDILKLKDKKLKKKRQCENFERIYLFFLTKNWSLNLRTIYILLDYIICFSGFRIKFATNVLSGTKPPKKDGAPTTDFAFLRKVEARARRHAGILDNSAHASGEK